MMVDEVYVVTRVIECSGSCSGEELLGVWPDKETALQHAAEMRQYWDFNIYRCPIGGEPDLLYPEPDEVISVPYTRDGYNYVMVWTHRSLSHERVETR